jgi:hypothetical protein
VRNFSRLVQEVFFFGDDNFQRLNKFLNERLEYDLKEPQENGENPEGARLAEEEEKLRSIAENEIRRRMMIISEYVTAGEKTKDYSSLDEVFRKMTKSGTKTGIPSRRTDEGSGKRAIKKGPSAAKNVS